jgi:glyoxylase-like metal-dependent hydrolase (beta-lactamase superfamily II)
MPVPVLRSLALITVLILAPLARAAAPLEVEVLRTSGASLFVNVALIKGEQKAVLVDVPFTLADAHRVVAMVLDSGKELESIFITHDHPDHFFALEVVTTAFPDARVLAHPTVVADIWRSLPFKVRRWSPQLGANAPRMPTAPSPLAGDSFELEGHELRVIGPMQGDHHHATALYAPSAAALFPGDLVYNGMYLWFGEHGREEIAAWGESLERLAALGASTVVAGHSAAGLPDDASGIAFSRDYIDAWLQAMDEAEDSAALRAAIQARFPEAVDVLGDFLLGTSSRVSMGEIPRWQE